MYLSSSLHKLRISRRHTVMWSITGSHRVFLRAWRALRCGLPVLPVHCQGSLRPGAHRGLRSHPWWCPAGTSSTAAPNSEQPALGPPAEPAFCWLEEGSLRVRHSSWGRPLLHTRQQRCADPGPRSVHRWRAGTPAACLQRGMRDLPKTYFGHNHVW